MVLALKDYEVARLQSFEFSKTWRWSAMWEHADMHVIAHPGHVPFDLRDALCQVI